MVCFRRKSATGISAWLLAITSATACCAQDPSPQPAAVHGIDRFADDPAAQELLLRQRFVVLAAEGPRRAMPLEQLFSPYIEPVLPVFVTPDLVFDAYGALFARVMAEVEQRERPLLLAFSERLATVAGSRGDHGGRILGQVAAIALSLQRGTIGGDDPSIREILSDAADLEPTSSDFARPEVAGHFRARMLYQRFHARSGSAAALALQALLAEDAVLRDLHGRLQLAANALVGPPVREADRVRILPGAATPMAEIAQHRSPAFSATGLSMLAIGPLRSAAGCRIWSASHPEIDPGAAEAVAAPDSHFGRALAALALLSAPDTRAEPLFHSVAWADLQANTQLAGWAELRHVCQLHAQQISVLCRGGSLELPHRVAPYPGFFAALGRLAAELREWRRAYLLAGDDVAALQVRLAGLASLLDMADASGRTDEQERDLVDLSDLCERLLAEEIRGLSWDELDLLFARRLRAVCAAPPGELPPADRRLLTGLQLGLLDGDLATLADLSERLAVLADDQLAGRPTTADDARLLEGLGITIARLCGYRSNSYRRPKDDHPRVVSLGRWFGQMLQVGVGRPERLYLILEADGGPRLFVGAVLSYREQLVPSGRVGDSDSSWRGRVLNGTVPAPPEFTRSFRR